MTLFKGSGTGKESELARSHKGKSGLLIAALLHNDFLSDLVHLSLALFVGDRECRSDFLGSQDIECAPTSIEIDVPGNY